jgi:mono/diheme cytochrome c family protein
MSAIIKNFFQSVGDSVGSHAHSHVSRRRGGWTMKIFCILSVVMATSASTFAGTVNIFGKISDTTTATALDSVIVKLNHTTNSDTTSANGVFLLTGQVVNTLNGLVSRAGSSIRCVGENVHFTVKQQTRVSIETFNTSGKLLAKPFDRLVASGAYRVPVGLGMASQIIYVRISCGNDVSVFRMRGAMSRGKAQIKHGDLGSKQAPLFKVAAAATGDTLVFTRNNYTTKKLAISSLTSTDSVRIALWPACADDSIGGRLYDKFWAPRTGYSQTDTALINRLTRSADFFRCEQCHGFDLLGKTGGYAYRGPNPKRPNVCGVNLVEVSAEPCKEIFDLIKTGDDSTKRRAPTADLSTYDPATNKTIGDQMPKYGALLSDKQIWALVKFLKTGFTNPKLVCDYTISGTYPNGVVTCSNIGKDGDTVAGNSLYSKNCKGCHGADGKQIIIMDGIAYSAGSHVRAKPYDDVQEIRYHLFGATPDFSVQQLKDMFKALIDTVKYPNSTKDDSLCYKANGVNGGKLYDQFWLAETTFTPTDTAKFNLYADFFRCKQCHGWDLLGTAGGYANRAPNTKRPNVCGLNLFAVSSEVNSEIFHLIKTGDDSTKRRAPTANLSTYDPATNKTIGDQMPNYGAILSDRQIWDLVNFFKTQVIDAKQLDSFVISGTYPTATVTYLNIGKNGNADTGNTYYTTNCAGCHNADGKKFSVDGTYSVGSHLRAKPYEDAHKIKFGVLGTTMKDRKITLAQMKNLFKALSDTTKYPNP